MSVYLDRHINSISNRFSSLFLIFLINSYIGFSHYGLKFNADVSLSIKILNNF